MPNDRLLEIDEEALAAGVDRRPFPVRHRLAGHDLLSLASIAELADRLPRSAIERHRADLGLLAPGGAPALDGSPSADVLGIETNDRWMVLWNIEQDPTYAGLLDACLDEVQGMLDAAQGGMLQREAFIFLSAPGAVTPVHFDPEHNFLLQIRGMKEMNVGRFADRAAQLAELDRYHDGGHRNLEAVPADFTLFRLQPGEGVYVHPFAPHFVRNGPAPSVSLSITFRTDETARRERVHRFNSRLRRVGLHPRPPGDSARRDRAKAALWEGAGRLKRRPRFASR